MVLTLPPRWRLSRQEAAMSDAAAKARARYAAMTPEQRQHRNAKKRAWSAANPDAVRKMAAAFHERNPGKRTEYRRAWREANADRHRENMALRRARRSGVHVQEIDRAEIIARDASTCHICREICSPDEIHLDHIVPLSRGGEHAEANLAVSHAICNQRKGTRLLIELQPDRTRND